MAVEIVHPAGPSDVIGLLAGGARAVPRRLAMVGVMHAVTGYSYALRIDGRTVAVAGFWPDQLHDARVDAALGPARERYVVWFIAGDGAGRHVGRILRMGRELAGTLKAGGAQVVAEIDPSRPSAGRLARAMGLVPRTEIDGHHLHVYDPGGRP